MKTLLALTCLLSLAIPSFAQTPDTLQVQGKDLNFKALQLGDYDYILYFKKDKDSAAKRFYLIKMTVEAKQYHNKPAYVIDQKWDHDSVAHISHSVFDAKDFSTLFHDTYWRQLGYAMVFDFETKKVDFRIVDPGTNIPDSDKVSTIKDFNESFEKYNLNWHEDLIIYSLLPYKDKRTFAINFFDPGSGPSQVAMYTVTGSDSLIDRDGKKIDCWVLNRYHDNEAPAKGYQRFWIAKKSREVLKEEDASSRGYRYKFKLGVAGV
jgi:hypothetical protein